MKPILFSTEMVRALLNTKPDTWPPEPIDPAKPFKWMTRRVIKPQLVSVANAETIDYVGNGEFVPVRNNRHGPFAFKCPYGQPGDVLWVREKWAWGKQYSNDYSLTLESIPKEKPDYAVVWYAADNEKTNRVEKWKPSIHMPRWAARLFLLVKDVRVERLQDIKSIDAEAEGVERLALNRWRDYRGIEKEGFMNPVASFVTLWDSINGKKYPWESNPCVWVVSFMRTKRPVTL